MVYDNWSKLQNRGIQISALLGGCLIFLEGGQDPREAIMVPGQFTDSLRRARKLALGAHFHFSIPFLLLLWSFL